MPEPLYLLIGIHNHQPVGNFDHVFEDAFKKCYWPLLNILERYPDIKISLHHSGPLIDWAKKNDPNYITTLVNLVKRGQVEIMGGGYYEPILPILKPKDALGQIKMMQDFWEKEANFIPKGMWLAERVWEPSLASLLSDAGMSYTILDDEHFRHAGMTDPTLLNYYITERAGKTVAIFPSDQRLRYLIPFKPVEEVMAHLISLADAAPGVGITYGDDGEKFGVWPGTYEWVIQKGWLERFFSELSRHRHRIVTTTFSEFMSRNQPTKTIFLPTASYQEMLEWAMPADAIFRYEQVRNILKKSGMWELAAPFLRGGFFDNFLTKYLECNLMHKKMLFVSDRIDEMENSGELLPDARQALYRAQCNCAYWHGLFGGLYLNHLRHAVYENLLKAEAIVDEKIHGKKPYTTLLLDDIDFDWTDEAIVSTPLMQLIISPKYGGSISELSYRPVFFNLQNTLARRYEAYHRPSEERGENIQSEDVSSIHEMGKDIRAVSKDLIYDRHPRFSLLDHILPAETNWEEVRLNHHEELIDFADKNYSITKYNSDEKGTSILLESEGYFSQDHLIRLKKEYLITSEDSIKVNYTLKRAGTNWPDIIFATELNMTLLAGHEPSRYYQWSGTSADKKTMMDSRKTISNCVSLSLVDEAFKFKVSVNTEPSAKWVFWPIETISQSEKGFDRLYQGSNIWISFKPKWDDKGHAHFSVCISLKSL